MSEPFVILPCIFFVTFISFGAVLYLFVFPNLSWMICVNNSTFLNERMNWEALDRPIIETETYKNLIRDSLSMTKNRNMIRWMTLGFCWNRGKRANDFRVLLVRSDGGSRIIMSSTFSPPETKSGGRWICLGLSSCLQSLSSTQQGGSALPIGVNIARTFQCNSMQIFS